jgi:hypothetical protein
VCAQEASPEEEGPVSLAEPSQRLIPLELSGGACNGRACDRGACDGGTCGGACPRACCLSGICPQTYLHLLSPKGGTPQPRQLANVTTVASVGYMAHPLNE